MYNEISVQFISLIYIVILGTVYFLKRKYNFIESKMYKILLILTTITLIVDITNIFILEKYQILGIFSTKIYFLLVVTWFLIFITYILLNRTTEKYETIRDLLKKSFFAKTWLIAILLLFSFMILLPVEYQTNPIYYTGKGVTLIYSIGVFGSIFLLILLIISNKRIIKYKNWSMLFSILLFCLTCMIQMYYSKFFIVGSGIAIVTIFLYFTMENPDLKYIDELNSLKIAAEDANKAKTDFLASMSHEIRTPMNAIIGLSQSLLNSELNNEVRDDIKSINKAGSTLLELVNNILDITKIEEGKTTINKKEYSLGEIIAELKSIIEINISEKPIKFSVETIGNIPSKLLGDDVKVYQVLMNLLSNAAKYTKKGSIRLVIESKIFGSKANLKFQVIDTGIGIRKEDQDKIFQKFERLDQEKKNIQGTGLGLVITKQLITMMGGKLSFTSVYQEGTTFTFELDQEIINKETISDISTYEAKKKNVDEYFDGSSYQILLVDDNQLNLKVAEKLLKKYNFNITAVSSGLECLNRTKNTKYDLILLDHMMPEMDGIHTLYNLKQRANGFDTPVVVLTANAIEGSKEMYLREGFCDYLSKPINQVELDRILREQLKIK